MPTLFAYNRNRLLTTWLTYMFLYYRNAFYTSGLYQCIDWGVIHWKLKQKSHKTIHIDLITKPSFLKIQLFLQKLMVLMYLTFLKPLYTNGLVLDTITESLHVISNNVAF